MKQLIQRYPVLAFFAIIIALGWTEPIFRFAGEPGNSNMNVHLRWLCCSLTDASPPIMWILKLKDPTWNA